MPALSQVYGRMLRLLEFFTETRWRVWLYRNSGLHLHDVCFCLVIFIQSLDRFGDDTTWTMLAIYESVQWEQEGRQEPWLSCYCSLYRAAALQRL
jgi:hypothetical protein